METTELRSNISSMVVSFVAKANETWPNLKMKVPEIDWFTRGTFAGKAYYLLHKVTFNEILAKENFSSFQQTVVHEVCHLVTRKLFPKATPHGKEWKSVMRIMGARPDRCHKYEVSSVKETKSKPKRYIYVCLCDKEHLIGGQRHSNISKGFKRFHCNTCKEIIKYTGKIRNWS